MTKDNKALFFECLLILLRPVLRFCLRNSLKLNDVIEGCKIVFLQLAEEELKKDGRMSSISKLSVMTGVHRVDATRLSQREGAPEARPSLISRVIGRWRHQKRFSTKAGQPRVLSVHGKQSEFWDLVRTENQDLNPYTILFELERSGAVERTAKGLKLKTQVFVPSHDIHEGVKILAADAEDFMSAIEENLAQPENPQNYHLVTEFDNLVEEAGPKFAEWIAEEGARFHRKVRNFLSRYDVDLNPELDGKPGGLRIVFGGFSRRQH
jgi:hypothetical protein